MRALLLEIKAVQHRERRARKQARIDNDSKHALSLKDVTITAQGTNKQREENQAVIY